MYIAAFLLILAVPRARSPAPFGLCRADKERRPIDEVVAKGGSVVPVQDAELKVPATDGIARPNHLLAMTARIIDLVAGEGHQIRHLGEVAGP